MVLIINYLVKGHAKTDGKTSKQLNGNTVYSIAA